MPERGEIPINPGNNVFAERFAKNAEAKIEADKIKNTHDNAVDMVRNNVDFFGRCDEEKRSEIAIRVLGRFGRGYQDVQSMINETNNPSKNQRIAHGDIDSLAESVRIAMDMSAMGKDLVTDSMTAEQIDENLPKEMKGIGKRIKEKGLMDDVKDNLIEINNVIEQDNLFTTQNKVVRGEVYKKWGEKVKTLSEGSYVKKYVEVVRSVFEDLGVSDVIEKKGEASVSLDQAAEKIISAAAEKIAEAAGKAEEKSSTKEILESIKKMADKFAKTIETMAKPKKEEKGKKRGTSTADGTIFQYEDFNFNGTEEEQMGYIEERLRVLEDYNTEDIKRELALSQITYPLFYLKDNPFKNKVPERIKEILNARLSLKRIGDAMEKNSGYCGRGCEDLKRLVNEFAKEGFDLSPKIMKDFMENRINDFKTAEGWNLLEMFNFGYETMLDQVWGKKENGNEFYGDVGRLIDNSGFSRDEFLEMVPLGNTKGTKFEGKSRNYYLDKCGQMPRADVCREYMISTIWETFANEKKSEMAKKGVTNYELTENDKVNLRYKAEKSVQLAEFMYNATAEFSVVNWDFINGDEVSEVINSGLCRRLDSSSGKKGKLIGPKISISRIPHLSVGFVRQFSIDKDNNLWPDPSKPIYIGENKFLEGISEFKGSEKEALESKFRVNLKGLNGKKLWAPWWGSIFSSKLYAARADILDPTTPDTKEVLSEQYFQGVIDHFNKVDAEIGTIGVVKTNWLAGKIQMALFQPNSSWTRDNFKHLESLVRDYMYTTENGVEKSFVTKEQWEWIKDQLDLDKNLKELKRHEIVQAFLGGKKG